MPAIQRNRRLGTAIRGIIHKRTFGSMDNSTVLQYQDRGSTLGKTIANTLDMSDSDISSLVSNDNINPQAGP